MFLKRLSLAVLLLAGFFAQDAFSQRRQANIFVGKCAATTPIPVTCDATVGTLTAAIAMAVPGNVIEIIDTETYDEHITITGDKNGITIRSTDPTSRSKPVIRFNDRVNVYPQNGTQAGMACGDMAIHGQICSGNFETNGAIRIIGAQGVTLDGITVDGGGHYPFGFTGVWGAWPLFHGNSTVAIAGGAGNVTIRNCDLRNAYHGIAVKDRNVGGVFPNSNPGDIDKANQIPLSSFGRGGNHLIEYNRIHNNTVGFYSESAWDLGSTIRYNLFYNNFHPAGRPSEATVPGGNQDKQPGAIVFKDHALSPVAIYNNTFYGNAGNINAKMQFGGQNLIFNNIFSNVTRLDQIEDAGTLMIETMHPYRIHNSVFSSWRELRVENRYVNTCPPHGENVSGITQLRIENNWPDVQRGTTTVTCPTSGNSVQTGEFFAPGGAVSGLNNGRGFGPNSNIKWLQMEGYANAGVQLLESLFQSVTPSEPNFLHPRWDHPLVIQHIRGQGWGHVAEPGQAVAVGNLNSNGTPADIGAISSNSTPAVPMREALVARAVPTTAVTITGTAAAGTLTAEFRFDVFDAILGVPATLENTRIKMLRWVAPVPNARNDEQTLVNAQVPIAAGSITPISAAVGQGVNMGANRISFPLPPMSGTLDADANRYGFFELVVEGTAPGGRTVVSDVAFLPYTRLRNRFDVDILNAAGQVVIPSDVGITAGEEYRLRITAWHLPSTGPATLHTTGIREIDFQLFTNNMSSTMWIWGTDTPFESVGSQNAFAIPNGQSQNSWPVYFKTAGLEQIRATGLGQNQQGVWQAFLGTGEMLVKPGPPEKVTFITPGPRSQLHIGPGPNDFAPAIAIPPGGPFEVTVGVTDKFDNLVDTATPLNLTYEGQIDGVNCQPIGQPMPQNGVNTNPATGIATFEVRVNPTCGSQGNWFDMRAAVASGPAAGAHDIGRLRVGRTQDQVFIYFSDNANVSREDAVTNWGGNTDPIIGINVRADGTGHDGNGNPIVVTDRMVPVYLKAVSGGAVMSRTFPVCVSSPHPAIEFYSDAGGVPGTRFTNTDNVLIDLNAQGEGQFWITSNSEVIDGCIDAMAVQSVCGSGPNSAIRGANPRCEIYFAVPTSNVDKGIVFSKGNGHGIPDEMVVQFLPDGDNVFGAGWSSVPDTVELFWPTDNVGAAGSVTGTLVRVAGTGAIGAAGCIVPVPAAAPVVAGNEGRELRVSMLPECIIGGVQHAPGYTSVFGSRPMLGRLHWNAGATAGTGTYEWTPFNVIDSIGPIISVTGEFMGTRESPMIVENIGGARQDTLMIQISEELANYQVMLTGASIEHKKPGAGGAVQTITVEAVTRVGDWYRLALAGAGNGYNIVGRDDGAVSSITGLPEPILGDSIRFLPAKGVADANGSVNLINRFVEIGLKPLAPEILATSFYENRGGVDSPVNQVNYVQLDFAKFANKAWFDEIAINILNGPSARAKVSEMPDEAIVSAGATSLGIDLSLAFPAVFGTVGGAARNVTSGTMTINITYDKTNAVASEWDATPGVISDKALPVLVSEPHESPNDDNYRGAVLRPGSMREGGGSDPDTLVITYSERLSTAFAPGAAVEHIMVHREGGVVGIPHLIVVSSSNLSVNNSGDGWQQVVYIIGDQGFRFPGADAGSFLRATDRVSINPGSGIVDNAANAQDMQNKRIPVKIMRGDWILKIKNNPFTSRPGTGRDSTTVIFSPNLRGANDLKTSVKVALYDNLGNLVRMDEARIDVANPANNYLGTTPAAWRWTGGELEWTWKGRNRRNRFVGSGTYYMKAVMTRESGGEVDQDTQIRPIGFVR